MNIIEALKSGRRFKRPCMSVWLQWKPSMVYPSYSSEAVTDAPQSLTGAEMLADDWMLEPKPVPVTLETFWGAYKRACCKTTHVGIAFYDVADEIANELGLKP